MRFSFASTRSSALAVMVALAACAAGCEGESEGDRCDTLAAGGGSSDCKSGLTCQRLANLGLKDNHSGVCCPVDLSQATTSTCSANGGAINASTGPSDDAGDGGSDATVDDGAAAPDAAGDDGASTPDSAGDAGAAEASLEASAG